MIRFIKRVGSFIGTGARAFVALVGVGGITIALANYTMTQGAGTNFGSVVVSTVHYAQHVLCDFVAPNTTCAAVKAANTVASTDVGVVVAVANTNANGQAVMASSSPVVIASNQSAVPVVNGAADPCQTTANSSAPITISTATTTRIITPSASNRTYICSIDLLAFAANNVAIVEGTGGTCGTGTAGVVGGTTAATGVSFPAQGGLVRGGAGFYVWRTAGTNVDFCLITSTTGPLSGFVKYVQAP